MAASCLRLAKRADNAADSAFLLDLAFRWHMLAQGTILDLPTAHDIAQALDRGTSLRSRH